MHCTFCGNQLAEGADFCIKCGNSVPARTSGDISPTKAIVTAPPTEESGITEKFIDAQEPPLIQTSVRAFPEGEYISGAPAAGPNHPAIAQGIAGIVCAVMSFLYLPLVFGATALSLGIWTKRKGEATFGIIVIVLSILGTVGGFLFSYYIGAHPSFAGATLLGVAPFLLH